MGHPVPALLYSILFYHGADWVMVTAFVTFGLVFKAIIETSVKSLYLSAVSYTSLNTCVISLKRSSPNSLRTTPGTIIISCRLFIPHLHSSKYKDLSRTHLLRIAKDAQVPGGRDGWCTCLISVRWEINTTRPVKDLQGREILKDRGINSRIIFFTSCRPLFQHTKSGINVEPLSHG